MVILAPGALGGYDEILFIGTALMFLVMMGISWLRSRNAEPILEDPDDSAPSDTAPLDDSLRLP